MANYNRVQLMGNLTRDIEVRHTTGGMAVAKLGMAINRKTTKDGEKRETTCYVDCTAFDKSAELINQYCRKGSPLFIEGRLEFETWEDKATGAKRSKLSVVVENFQFLGGDRDEAPAPRKAAAPAKEDIDYGDVPF